MGQYLERVPLAELNRPSTFPSLVPAVLLGFQDTCTARPATEDWTPHICWRKIICISMPPPSLHQLSLGPTSSTMPHPFWSTSSPLKRVRGSIPVQTKCQTSPQHPAPTATGNTPRGGFKERGWELLIPFTLIQTRVGYTFFFLAYPFDEARHRGRARRRV